jgi:putative ABC transport system permease protein
MIAAIAWKNVWRNKKRSLVVIVAVTLGIISGVLMIGIFEGWIKQRLDDAINNEASHIQIHNTRFLVNEELIHSVRNLDEITNFLDTADEIDAWSKRTRIVAMINSAWANTGVTVYGIDPANERQVTRIFKKIVPDGGRYPDNQNPGDILISDKTADILKIKQFILSDSSYVRLREKKVPEKILQQVEILKDHRFRSQKAFREAIQSILPEKEARRYGRLILDEALDYRIRNKLQVTMADREGTPVQGIFRVCGIFKTTNTGFDQVSVFVNAGELASLYGGGDTLIHEIAIRLNKEEAIETVSEKLTRLSDDNAVETWKELAPDAAMMHEFILMYYFIFIGIIMLALAFGIINTMLMSILERTKELGMLMAIGMNRRRIFNMIMLETIFLTAVGAGLGMLSGWGIVKILGKTGIHFAPWGEGFEAIGFSAKVYPVVTLEFLLFTTAMVITTAMVSSLWPARKALKLIPVEALRTE